MEITTQHYLVLGVILFALGAIGAVTRRNILVVLMSIGMMLSSSLIVFLAFARVNLLPAGKAVAIIVMGLVVIEIAVGLALVVASYRRSGSTSIDDFSLLKG
jgi:NADH-quinone oxidoreductase subunit K